MAFRGHTAVWANTGKNHYQPAFIRDETDLDKIEGFLRSHIHQVVSRYAGRYHAWDVVNEVIDVSNLPATYRDSVWNKLDDFVCKSFIWAHEADPTAELFYNDYNHATRESYFEKKADAVYDMVKDLLDRGCPIHGVGFQLHVDVDFEARVPNMITNIQRYQDLGIIVHMTEIDVKCRRDSDNNCVAWTDELLQQQALTYEKLLTACLEAVNCESFTMWGCTDKYSWLDEGMNGLPFDSDWNKKPAYYTLINTLNDFPRDHASSIARIEKKQRI